MSKRTIILFAVGLLAIAAGVVSMFFEHKKEVDDLNDIIDGIKPLPEKKPKKDKEQPITIATEDNGSGKTE